MEGSTRNARKVESQGPIRNENGNIIINAKDKAESFNHFFSTVGEKLADAIIPDNSLNILHHIYQVSPTIEPLKSILRR